MRFISTAIVAMTLFACSHLPLLSQPSHNDTLFIGSNQASGIQLWKTNNTLQGTVVAQLKPASSVIDHDWFKGEVIHVGGNVYFIYQKKLWVSDGTQVGTRVVSGFKRKKNHTFIAGSDKANSRGELYLQTRDQEPNNIFTKTLWRVKGDKAQPLFSEASESFQTDSIYSSENHIYRTGYYEVPAKGNSRAGLHDRRWLIQKWDEKTLNMRTVLEEKPNEHSEVTDFVVVPNGFVYVVASQKKGTYSGIYPVKYRLKFHNEEQDKSVVIRESQDSKDGEFYSGDRYPLYPFGNKVLTKIDVSSFDSKGKIKLAEIDWMKGRLNNFGEIPRGDFKVTNNGIFISRGDDYHKTDELWYSAFSRQGALGQFTKLVTFKQAREIDIKYVRGDRVYFNTNPKDKPNLYGDESEVWTSDGTQKGTFLLKNGLRIGIH